MFYSVMGFIHVTTQIRSVSRISVLLFVDLLSRVLIRIDLILRLPLSELSQCSSVENVENVYVILLCLSSMHSIYKNQSLCFFQDTSMSSMMQKM